MPAVRDGTAPSISVVVLSHNYQEFLTSAIDSALAQTYPVEVLVIDDGSTDGSRDVLTTYRDRVRTLLKDNGGNSSAVNAAVPATRGDIVMFLDADDVLYPEAAAEVARAWAPGCAKAQFRLSLIDAAGTRTGIDPAPGTAMPTGDVVPQILATGGYVTPVMTGNAFRRTVLEQLLPIPVVDFRNTNDGYLNTLCPFYGSVVSIDKELGAYRLHGRNLWAFSRTIDLPDVRQRLQYDLVRQRYLSAAATDRDLELRPDLLLSDPEHVLLRLVSLRHDPAGHPAVEDRVPALVRHGMQALIHDSRTGPLRRVLTCCALLAVGLLPRRAALGICDLVLTSRPRPAWVRRLARALPGARRP